MSKSKTKGSEDALVEQERTTGNHRRQEEQNKRERSSVINSFFSPCFRLVRRKQIEGSKGHTRGVMGSDGERRHCQKKYKKKENSIVSTFQWP